jgi:hypothetical protein
MYGWIFFFCRHNKALASERLWVRWTGKQRPIAPTEPIFPLLPLPGTKPFLAFSVALVLRNCRRRRHLCHRVIGVGQVASDTTNNCRSDRWWVAPGGGPVNLINDFMLVSKVGGFPRDDEMEEDV